MSESKPARFWNWVGGCLAAIVLLGIGLFVGLWAVVVAMFGGTTPLSTMPSTQTHFVGQVRGGQLEFDLTYGRETSEIQSFIVSSADGSPLWELTGGPKPAKVYGQVPAGWKQVLPVDGSPPPDVRGRRIKVRIDTKFHVAFGPGVEVNEGEVDVPGP